MPNAKKKTAIASWIIEMILNSRRLNAMSNRIFSATFILKNLHNNFWNWRNHNNSIPDSSQPLRLWRPVMALRATKICCLVCWWMWSFNYRNSELANSHPETIARANNLQQVWFVRLPFHFFFLNTWRHFEVSISRWNQLILAIIKGLLLHGDTYKPGEGF